MKLPRDVSGLHLAKALRKLGYEFTRQRGSHIGTLRSKTASTILPSRIMPHCVSGQCAKSWKMWRRITLWPCRSCWRSSNC